MVDDPLLEIRPKSSICGHLLSLVFLSLSTYCNCVASLLHITKNDRTIIRHRWAYRERVWSTNYNFIMWHNGNTYYFNVCTNLLHRFLSIHFTSEQWTHRTPVDECKSSHSLSIVARYMLSSIDFALLLHTNRKRYKKAKETGAAVACMHILIHNDILRCKLYTVYSTLYV